MRIKNLLLFIGVLLGTEVMGQARLDFSAFDRPDFLGVRTYSGFGIDYTTTKDEHSLNLGIRLNLGEVYYGQWNVANMDWLDGDRYNNNRTNRSFLSCFSAPAIFIFDIPSLINDACDGNSDWMDYLVLVPGSVSLLINSSHHLILLSDYDSGHGNYLFSFFLRTKLDYYMNNDEKWWRYKPAAGLEFMLLSPQNKFNLAIDGGFDKPIDYQHGYFVKNDFRPFIGVKFFWGVKL